MKIDGGGDLPALLKEYPLAYPSGKKKNKVLMYLAANIKETILPGRNHISLPFHCCWFLLLLLFLFFWKYYYISYKKYSTRLIIFLDTPKQIARVTSYGLRRSPRLNKKDMDVFLYEVIDGKISPSSTIIHDVSTKASIKELTDLIHGQICDAIFVPAKDMFWIRKRSKQLVALKTEQDFEAEKKE